MQILRSKKWMGLLFGLIFILALCVTYSPAQEKIKVAGKNTISCTLQKTIDVGDMEGHTIILNKQEGFNESTGDNKFMCGAEVVVMTCADYVKGNGVHWGYVKMTLNGDVIYCKIKGKTTTTLSDKGTPITTTEGKFSMIKGEGQYNNIQGEGTYKGKAAPGKMLISEWEGEYFIKK